jgi:hypothetical protein
MAYIAITFEELMNPFPDPVDISPLLDFDDIDDSLNIMEKCLELYDVAAELLIYESQYACAKALAFEGEKWEKLKETVKNIWLKIIEYIKKAVKYVIGIITWPFRMINKLLTRYKKIKIDMVVGLRHEGIEIDTPLESISKSMDEIRKEQGKFDSEYIFDLDEIKKYVKQFEEWADLHYKQNFTIAGKSVSFDDLTKAITKTLGDRSKIVQNRKSLLHNIIIHKTKAQLICMKPKKILDALNNITKSLKDTCKLASSVQNVESILFNLLDRLASLEKKIEKCTYEDINAMKAEERESIYYTLSLIRSYVTDFATLNIDISKFYRNIDDEVEKINDIVGFTHESFTNDMVTETIGDIKVVVDDLFVCHDDRAKFIKSEKKGAFVKTGDGNYHASRNDRSWKYKGIVIKNVNDLKKYSTITISEGIYYLSKTNKPSHLKNLYIGISQELQTKWYDYLVGYEYNYHYPDMVRNNFISDTLRSNAIELTRDQSIQLQLWYEKREYPRLLKIYKEYLKNYGIFVIEIIKPGRLQPGLRFRHRL